MTGILSWILGIVWRAAVVTLLVVAIRTIIRNGGGTIRLVFETIVTCIKYGCLSLRLKLTSKIKEKEVTEVQELEPCDDHDGIAAEGTVR